MRLRIRAAGHGRFAEAEYREILKASRVGSEQRASRKKVALRLAEFWQRTALTSG